MQDTAVTDLPRPLGGGLILRQAVPDDAQAVADFNANIHRPRGADESAGDFAWTLDLFERRLPGVGPEHFLVVEDTRAGRIVSVTNLMEITWSIGGIPFAVGRPESVGTLPEYRDRGLIRAQFAVLHAWSEARGDLAQAITGIPYYYRQFGYEMAMDLEGGRLGCPLELLSREGGEASAFQLRAVVDADLPFILQLDGSAGRRNVVACLTDEAHWRYELFGKRAENLARFEWRLLETPAGDRAGYFAYAPRLNPEGHIAMPVCELADGYSWLAAAPVILRCLLAEGELSAGRAGKRFAGIYAQLGSQHPFLDATHLRLPEIRRPYAWYVRVPDLLRFLQHIAPALEARLARSVAAHYSGRLKISLYRRGIGLDFEDGRMPGIRPWRPSYPEEGDILVPELTFLQLLFGWRNIDELYAQYPDCLVENDDARVLARALFPKGPSPMWPVV